MYRRRVTLRFGYNLPFLFHTDVLPITGYAMPLTYTAQCSGNTAAWTCSTLWCPNERSRSWSPMGLWKTGMIPGSSHSPLCDGEAFLLRLSTSSVLRWARFIRKSLNTYLNVRYPNTLFSKGIFTTHIKLSSGLHQVLQGSLYNVPVVWQLKTWILYQQCKLTSKVANCQKNHWLQCVWLTVALILVLATCTYAVSRDLFSRPGSQEMDYTLVTARQ